MDCDFTGASILCWDTVKFNAFFRLIQFDSIIVYIREGGFKREDLLDEKNLGNV